MTKIEKEELIKYLNEQIVDLKRDNDELKMKYLEISGSANYASATDKETHLRFVQNQIGIHIDAMLKYQQLIDIVEAYEPNEKDEPE